METMVEVKGIDRRMSEEDLFHTTNTTFSSKKKIGNPIVYKLVRIEGDGRIVPATDDEILEVKDLLENNRSKMHVVAETGQTEKCLSSEGLSSVIPQSNNSAGAVQPEIEVVDVEMLNAELEDSVRSLEPSVNDCHRDSHKSVGECSNPLGVRETGSPVSALLTKSKPDFSKVKGELCLDNLSIRELQKTFYAAFGRETTVKDKQWLKRRIVMGLTNSCDIPPTTSFTIKDNKLVEGKAKIDNDVDSASTKDSEDETSEGPPAGAFSLTSNHRNASENGMGDNDIDYYSESVDLDTGERSTKRVRKPTRRYIEELSETELKNDSGKSTISSKDTGPKHLTPKSHHLRSVRSVSSGGRTVVTRQDSLAGSRIQIPCVSRVRTTRPRKNIMGLMRFHPSSMGAEPNPTNNSLILHESQLHSGHDNRCLSTSSSPEYMQLLSLEESEKNKQHLTMSISGVGQNMETKDVDSSGNMSDDNLAPAPTVKGGVRRKHHRAWTPSEVNKLVDGVSRYGAGRWSEIKRLVFASYQYRTSVDLKDKWRNLLKASFAYAPSDKGSNSRKQASTPVPPAILLRVKELAEMQGIAPPNLNSSKAAGGNVNESRSGYL